MRLDHDGDDRRGRVVGQDALAGGGSCEAEYTIRSFVPAANGKYYLGSRNGVLRSTDGATWEHVPGTERHSGDDRAGLEAGVRGEPVAAVAPVREPRRRRARGPISPRRRRSASGSDGGIPFLAYDDAHHILYASMFSGGVARMVVP